MIHKRLLAAAVSTLVAAAGLVAGATAAQAEPVCNVPEPPPICDREEPVEQYPPVGSAEFVQDAGGFTTNQIGGMNVSGLVTDGNGGPVKVDIKINGVKVATAVADRYRPTGNLYSATVELPMGNSTVCAVAQNFGGGPGVTLGCHVVHGPIGRVESVTSNGRTTTVTGWVIDPDTAAPVTLRFSNFGKGTFTDHVANQHRADIGSAYPAYGAAHGFSITHTWPYGSCLDVQALNIGLGADVSAYNNCLR
ncbi:hypothetical protein [Actinoplanes sp. DH11]|uniref:hypothetical protein n=1 Tax=Actinoplanes sp. DH11 TaxID=2857011 RepID=UPI001E560FDC|nr:hypothetical protein [Actinoplanes sp. DH11]